MDPKFYFKNIKFKYRDKIREKKIKEKNRKKV
jgi:hypothetical protein